MGKGAVCFTIGFGKDYACSALYHDLDSIAARCMKPDLNITCDDGHSAKPIHKEHMEITLQYREQSGVDK